MDVRKAAAPLLKAAAVKFNETVFLSRFRNEQVEIIHVETPDDPARAFIHPGLGVRPMHACSCSKAIAAFAEPAFQDSIITRTLRAYTEFTKTTEADLRLEFNVPARFSPDPVAGLSIRPSSTAAPENLTDHWISNPDHILIDCKKNNFVL